MDTLKEIIKRELIIKNLDTYLKELQKLKGSYEEKIGKVKENISKEEEKINNYNTRKNKAQEYAKILKEQGKIKRIYMLYLPFLGPAFSVILFGLIIKNIFLTIIISVLTYLLILLFGTLSTTKENEITKEKLDALNKSVSSDAVLEEYKRQLELKKGALGEYEKENNNILEQISITNNMIDTLRSEIISFIAKENITPELKKEIDDTNLKIMGELKGKSRVREKNNK